MGIVNPWTLDHNTFYFLAYGALTEGMSSDQLDKFHAALDGEGDEAEEKSVSALRRAGQDASQIAMRREMASAKTASDKVKAREQGRKRRREMLERVRAAKTQKADLDG